MQKSISVSLSSLKNQSLYLEARVWVCSPHSSMPHVVHSVLMWKECCLMLCTQSWCEKNVIIWPKKCLGFAHPVLCALLPHVEKKMFFISTWNHRGAHPSEVYFGITLSCIILGGREGGGTQSVFVGTDLIIDLQYLCFCSCIGLGWFWECNCRASFVSMALRSSPLWNWSALWLLINPCQSKL